MISYRATLRFITERGRHQYHVEDIDASDLLGALRRLIEVLPDEAGGADLVELRRHGDPDEREYTPQ